MKRVVLALTLLVFPARVHAWGEAGHYIVSEAATLSLPNDMPSFFYEAFPQLIWLSYDPDRWRGAGPSIDAVNPADHYVDYEFIADLELSPDRYEYISLLESSGTLRKHGIAYTEAGFLPWTIAELSERLTAQWRVWRGARGSDRIFVERAIVNTAGVLGHFIGDAANPHHTTINHNGWILANPRRYPIDCGTHARFETVFVSHAVETNDVVPVVASPVRRGDYFDEALRIVKSSNALVEQLYRIDRDGGFDFIGRPPAAGKAFAVDRLATGASTLRDFWWSAWKNSERPPKRGE